MTNVSEHAAIDDVIEQWEAALGQHDAAGLVATYAADAVLESPLVLHVTGRQGRLQGHAELRPFFEQIVKRTPALRGFHRGVYFAEGRRAIWEYPRETPGGYYR